MNRERVQSRRNEVRAAGNDNKFDAMTKNQPRRSLKLKKRGKPKENEAFGY